MPGPTPVEQTRITPPVEAKGEIRAEAIRYPIIVDGRKETYPKNYPEQFIANGALAEIGKARLGNVKRAHLAVAIDAYLTPTRDILLHEEKPQWYSIELAPLIEKLDLSPKDLQPESLYTLGDDFFTEIDKLYKFQFPEGVAEKAARAMGQKEGKVPTLSALMREMKISNPEALDNLLILLLRDGPSGLTLAAYLSKLTNTQSDEEFNLDKLMRQNPDGTTSIDTEGMKQAVDLTWKSLHEGLSGDMKNVSDWYTNPGSPEYTPSSGTSHTFWGPNGEPYRMRVAKSVAGNTYGTNVHLNTDFWQREKEQEKKEPTNTSTQSPTKEKPTS